MRRRTSSRPPTASSRRRIPSSPCRSSVGALAVGSDGVPHLDPQVAVPVPLDLHRPVAAAVLDRVGQHLLEHPEGDDLELGRHRLRCADDGRLHDRARSRGRRRAGCPGPAWRVGAAAVPWVLASTVRTSSSEARAEVAMFVHGALEGGGVGVVEVLRRLGLGQDHRQRVADDVVHVAGEPGLVLAEPGDLLGLVALGLGLDL